MFSRHRGQMFSRHKSLAFFVTTTPTTDCRRRESRNTDFTLHALIILHVLCRHLLLRLQYRFSLQAHLALSLYTALNLP
jgi:hypothetical protein